MRGADSAATVIDDEEVDDPSRVRLILQTTDTKAKKCSLVIGKVSVVVVITQSLWVPYICYDS